MSAAVRPRRAVLGAIAALPALPWIGALAAPEEGLDLAAYRGKVVLLDFWASWCGPCKESFPWMQQIEERFADRGLVVLAVNVDHDRALADAFLQRHPAQFQILYDPRGALAERYQVSTMPSSFFIDRKGAVRHAHRGFRQSDRAEAELQLAALISEH